MEPLPCEMCDYFDCVTLLCTKGAEPEFDEELWLYLCDHFKEGEYL
jgi:hypothetical protein